MIPTTRLLLKMMIGTIVYATIPLHILLFLLIFGWFLSYSWEGSIIIVYRPKYRDTLFTKNYEKFTANYYVYVCICNLHTILNVSMVKSGITLRN